MAEGIIRNIFCEIILNLNKWFRKCHFRYFLSRALVAILFVSTILEEGIMRNISVNLVFNLNQLLRICHLELSCLSFSAERHQLGNFLKEDLKRIILFENIFNVSQWFRRRYRLKKKVHRQSTTQDGRRPITKA